MNDTKLLPEDPKLTAYALGELDAADHAEVEAAVRADPALQAAVAEIQALCGQLSTVLAHEPVAAPLTQEATMRPAVKKKPGTLLKFPQLYFAIGGLAAACFAVMIALREEPPKHFAEKKQYALMQAPAEAPVPSNRTSPELADGGSIQSSTSSHVVRGATGTLPGTGAEAEKSGSLVLQFKATKQPASGQIALQGSAGTGGTWGSNQTSDKLEAGPSQAMPTAQTLAPDERFAVDGAKASGDATGQDGNEGVVVLSPFAVTDEKDNGYLRTNSVTATRLNMRFQGSKSGAAQDYADDPNAHPFKDTLRYSSQGAGANYYAGAISANPGASPAPDGKFFRGGYPAGTVVNGINSGGYPAGPSFVIGEKEDEQRKKAAMPNVGSWENKIPQPGFTLRGFANTEAYARLSENDFLGVAQNPLSTFSIDVDTAGYANVRRFLNDGQRPPASAVRIEELVNYFPYHYAAPVAKDVPFAASMEVASAPWAPAHRLVRIGLKGREVSAAQRGAANLVFLLDVSGSMDEPNKLPLVKESLKLLVGKLRADDHVAIVVYAGASGLALPSTPVAKSADILAAIDELRAGGSTNGAMGIQLAYDIAKANYVTGGINRVVLCTDGDFNVGVTSEGELTRLIEEKAKSKVFLTVLGFGMGNLKDSTMEMLADKGNGNYGYIDSRREAEKLLGEQVNGTLVTIAKDVKLQVEFNPAQVASYRLIGYENRMLKKEDFNNDKVDAGEIGAGHTVTALYEVVPAGSAEAAAAQDTVDALKYRKPDTGNRMAQAEKNPVSGIADPVSAELLTLKVRYKEPTGDVSRKLEFALTDGGAKFEQASADFQFAAAVAEFGMILRESPHKGTGSLKEVATWARAATADDAGGYRGEFIGLVEKAEALQ